MKEAIAELKDRLIKSVPSIPKQPAKTKVSNLEAAAVEAIKKLNEAGKHAFITGESCGPEKRYAVVAKFKSLERSHDYHQALIDCGNAAMALNDYQAMQEAGATEKPAEQINTEGHTVQPHELRVLEECGQLSERLEKLVDFFDTNTFSRLDKGEQDRLDSQYHIMKAYRAILIQRIEAMGHEDLIPD